MEVYNECVKFEKRIFDKPILNVDATYIVHLENNGRLEDINNQLKEYNISKIVYIAYNKGFKKCKKEEHVINSMYDITDINFQIFQDAENKNYKNILILEDDFRFSSEMKNIKNINIINKFIKKRENEDFQYGIGIIPFVICPYDYNHYMVMKGIPTTTHAIIYSKLCRQNILKQDKKQITDWDVFTSKQSIKYIYYKPLCYQLFAHTENQSNWPLHPIILKILQTFNTLIKLDSEPEFGFHLMYIFAKILSLIIYFIIIYIIIRLCKSIKNN